MAADTEVDDDDDGSAFDMRQTESSERDSSVTTGEESGASEGESEDDAGSGDVDDDQGDAGVAPDALTLDERWERVVHRLRRENGTTSVKFEHAHPAEFEAGSIVLGCEQQYASFFRRDDHLEDIARAASELFGGSWEVSLEPWRPDDEEGQRETLADKREAERAERLQKLESDVRENEVVRRAQSLFDLDEGDVRVDVDLEE